MVTYIKKKYVYDTSDSTNYKLAFKKLKEIAGLQNGIFSYLFYGVFLEEYTSFSILPPNFFEYCSFSRTSGRERIDFQITRSILVI